MLNRIFILLLGSSKTKSSKEASSLTSAADLISLDSFNNVKQPCLKNKPAKIVSETVVPTISSEQKNSSNDRKFENKNEVSNENGIKIISNNAVQYHNSVVKFHGIDLQSGSFVFR